MYEVSTHSRRSLVQRRKIGNGGTKIKSVFSHSLEMLILGRIGRPDILMVSEFLGKSNHQMEQSL